MVFCISFFTCYKFFYFSFDFLDLLAIQNYVVISKYLWIFNFLETDFFSYLVRKDALISVFSNLLRLVLWPMICPEDHSRSVWRNVYSIAVDGMFCICLLGTSGLTCNLSLINFLIDFCLVICTLLKVFSDLLSGLP